MDTQPDAGPESAPSAALETSEEPAAAAPAEPGNICRLEKDGTRFTLVGTAHVSEKSVQEVLRIIEQERPDTVAVELCETRFRALTDSESWQKTDIFQVVRSGRTLFLLANLALSAYQRHIGKKLGVKPGAELLAAIEKAREVGAEVKLIDRDVQITLKRTWANLGFWKKNLLLASIFGGMFSREEVSEQDIEDLKQGANLSKLLETLAQEVPQVKEPLIDERDRFMMSGIEELPGKHIVAVVGAAHVPGMRANFGQPVDREAISQLPPPSKTLKVLKWLLPILVLSAFAYGYYQNEGTTLSEMLWAWILPNAVFAGLLTIIAGGKLLSIATALVTSPITSLNPLLGAGMVVGPVEAWLRKPTVEDFETVHEDFASLRGVYRNRVTRVLIVALAAHLGSALGGLVGFSWLIALLS